MKIFPVKILPNPFYKIIECNLSDYCLIRYTDGACGFDHQTGFVAEKSICSPKENISDLSTCLLGVFRLEFLKISLTRNGIDNYSAYCAPDEKVSTPVYEADYTIEDNRGYWSVLIKDINNTIVNYTKSNFPFTATCVVRHTPAKWNYWHFSINWEIEDGFWHNLDDKQRKTLDKRLAHEARTHIKFHAKCQDIPENAKEMSDKACYKKPLIACIKVYVRLKFQSIFRKIKERSK